MLARFLALAIILFPTAAFAASWTVSVDQRTGLPAISRGGVGALSSALVFWGKNRGWAGQQTEFNIVSPFEYVFVARNRSLDFDLSSHIKKSSTE